VAARGATDVARATPVHPRPVHPPPLRPRTGPTRLWMEPRQARTRGSAVGPATPRGALWAPAKRPGSLAKPWARLGARLLDGLIVSPLGLVCLLPVFIYVVANINEFPPPDQANNNAAFPTGFIIGFYAVGFICIILEMAVIVLWESVATRIWGRTPGKAILHLRPVKVAGAQVRFERMSKGTCWVRAAAYFGFNLVSVLGILDVLWCLWDGERQCLHDKVASTVVVND
jgi:uncharacterized RDD family membrane protein YckC